MGLGFQEIIALLIVTGIVGFALYRRLRRRKDIANAGCSGCENNANSAEKEKPVRFYRRQR